MNYRTANSKACRGPDFEGAGCECYAAERKVPSNSSESTLGVSEGTDYRVRAFSLMRAARPVRSRR